MGEVDKAEANKGTNKGVVVKADARAEVVTNITVSPFVLGNHRESLGINHLCNEVI